MNIFEAKKQLNDFLREHPHLQPEQDKIDKMLKGCVTQHNRNVMLQTLMIDNVFKMDALFKSIGL